MFNFTQLHFLPLLPSLLVLNIAMPSHVLSKKRNLEELELRGPKVGFRGVSGIAQPLEINQNFPKTYTS